MNLHSLSLWKRSYVPEREPTIFNQYGDKVETNWIQERCNQLALLDTFYGALKPQESLCFFYAKRTPLSEQSSRVIIGVGRVLSVGMATEYNYSLKSPPLRCVLMIITLEQLLKQRLGNYSRQFVQALLVLML